MKGLNSAEIQCFCWNEFHGHLWCHTFVPEASSFTANSLLLYWGNGQPGFHNSLFNPGFLFWINWMSIWGSRRSSDLHGLHIRKGAKCIPCGKGQVLRVYCSPWKPSGMLGFQACTLFPPPAPPRGLWQADFCETLCHEPLLILLFIWSMACICSEPAFGENAFWIKATTICLTPLKLLCFFWPQWDHELFSFPEDPSKHDSKDHGCVWGNERHRRHCACPWKFKFVLRETEGKQNKSTKVEHSVLLKKKKAPEISVLNKEIRNYASRKYWSGLSRAW